MLVSDLAGTPELGITVRVPGADGALRRRITWCAPTESIDPGPFLTPNAVMITCGMALNVSDPRIWDAYVERLARVPVAALAFGIGPAHRDMPSGLVAACENHGVPLLEIPPDVPFVSVLRDAQDRLAAERYEIVRRGAELADGCTRIAAAGGTLQDVLHQIATGTGARVSLADPAGATLVTAGAAAAPKETCTEFTLPGSDANRFRLLVAEPGETASPHLGMLLGPVAAVVSMQLSTTLGSAAVASSHNAGRLTEAIYTTAAIPTGELIRLARDSELEPYQPTGILVIAGTSGATTTYLRSVAWRARVMLGGEYPHMRYVDGPELCTVLVQGEEVTAGGLETSARAAAGPAAAVSMVVAVAENAAELGLTLRLARRTLGAPGVRQAPVLNFDAVVDTLSHPGVESLARRLLAPLARDSGAALLRTLESYLRHSGGTPAICEELYIHRNTLAYRVRKLEELLGVNLADGQVRATLLLAVRVHTALDDP